jgi:hypothetical protein
MSEDIKAKGMKMIETIQSLRAKWREQLHTAGELELVARLMLQGIDPNDVKSWGYDSHKDKRRRDVFAGRLVAVHNFVILKTGEIVDLDPPLPVCRKKPPAPIYTMITVEIRGRTYTAKIANDGEITALACEGHWPMMKMDGYSLGDTELWGLIKYAVHKLWKDL